MSVCNCFQYQQLKPQVLSVFLCATTVGCEAELIRPVSANTFDGRWVATMESPGKKRSGESFFPFQCESLTLKGGKTLNVVVKDGEGIVIGSGPTPEKGSVNTDGSFEFKKTYPSTKPTTDWKFIRVETEYTLSGSLAEQNAKYTVNYVEFNAGCEYQLTLKKVAESFKINTE